MEDHIEHQEEVLKLLKDSLVTTKKMTLFMALYGYHPSSINSSLKEKSKVQVVEDHIENQQQVLQS